VHTAYNWSAAPEGFLHPSYRNAAVSYAVGLDVFASDRLGLVSSDRNAGYSFGGGSCSSGVFYNGRLDSFPFPSGFGAGLHVDTCNFLFSDGRVDELLSAAFTARWRELAGGSDGGSAHFLLPSN